MINTQGSVSSRKWAARMDPTDVRVRITTSHGSAESTLPRHDYEVIVVHLQDKELRDVVELRQTTRPLTHAALPQ